MAANSRVATADVRAVKELASGLQQSEAAAAAFIKHIAGITGMMSIPEASSQARAVMETRRICHEQLL
jgi:hypothetical protein